MRIPEVREELLKISARIKACEKELWRRRGTRTPTRSRKMTAQMKSQAKRWRLQGWSHQAIADRLGVNSGRVSEALNGKRT